MLVPELLGPEAGQDISQAMWGTTGARDTPGLGDNSPACPGAP